ncbi:MAG: molybdopterin-dependent oxidoreductase [Bacteroidales bacterium]|nr:molybdopterin-dependent oxidoreductase [Bacteroidales bacterium]
MKEVSTACPRNCYSTCSFIVQLEEGEIKRILPESKNKAIPEGVCIKGLSYIERAVSKDRILTPMLRNSRGEFESISWDKAIRIISSKIQSYHSEFGPLSILYYSASGMSGLLNTFSTRFWKMIGGATTTYGNLCWPAGLEATRLTLGANKHNAPWDIKNARLIIMWGKNPAETNVQQMIHIEEALKSGAKMIVIDPRRTETSEKADILIQPKPGTDAFLALAIANQLIQRGLVDVDFINNNVQGFPEFKDHVRQFTPDKAEEITNVPIQAIDELTNLIGSTNPMTLVMGFGMQRFTNGGQTTRAILALSVITGNIGKPGACWHYANLQSYIFDTLKEPLNYYPTHTDSCFRRTIPTSHLGEGILKMHNPKIKMAWIERGNPLTQNPDSNIVKKAFDEIEFKVVIDQFMTDTAMVADLVLPAKNMFEQTDIIGSYWNPYVQLKPKILEPPATVKTELEIYNTLAIALGYDESDIRKYIIASDESSIEKWLKSEIERVNGPSWKALKTGPQIADSHEAIPYSDLGFDTPSGKIELSSQQATELWHVAKLPDYCEPKFASHEKFPFHLLTPNTKYRIHSQFGNIQSIKQFEVKAFVEINANDARKKGIMNGENVCVFNEQGSLTLEAKLDLSIKRGCISINVFGKAQLTDMGYGTAFHDVMVNIRKIGGE